MSEFVPIGETAIRVIHAEGTCSEPSAGAGPAWLPTEGDRVVTTANDPAGTITAVEERGDDTLRKVAFDHQPGEPELPERRSYSVRELTPLGKPAAAALEDSGNSSASE